MIARAVSEGIVNKSEVVRRPFEFASSIAKRVRVRSIIYTFTSKGIPLFFQLRCTSYLVSQSFAWLVFRMAESRNSVAILRIALFIILSSYIIANFAVLLPLDRSNPNLFAEISNVLPPHLIFHSTFGPFCPLVHLVLKIFEIQDVPWTWERVSSMCLMHKPARTQHTYA